MAKKKFSKEFLMKAAGDGWVSIYNLNNRYLRDFCEETFRRMFKMRVKDVPLDKETKVRIDITIL